MAAAFFGLFLAGCAAAYYAGHQHGRIVEAKRALALFQDRRIERAMNGVSRN